VCLLDGTLPEMSGFEVLAKARERKVTIPILMLNARDATADRVPRAGDGRRRLHREAVCVRGAGWRACGRCSAGVRLGATPFLAFGSLQLDPGKRRVTCGQSAVELSQKQFRAAWPS